MTFFFISGLVAAMVVGTWDYWTRLDESQDARRWLKQWIIRGLVVPIAVWMFFNLGLFRRLPSLDPTLDFAKSRTHWIELYLSVSARGVWYTGTFWTVATLLCLLGNIYPRVPDRRDFFASVGLWTLFWSPFQLLILHFFGWGSAGLFCMLWLFTLCYVTLPLVPKVLPKPIYSRAIAKMQFGKYDEAEAEVIHELEKHETDFEGWLMLAELYANHFNDLPAADRTIHEMCQEPKVTVSQIAVALNRLADWHLKIGKDPVSARRVLEEVCQRLPGTHLDRMARQRISHLPHDKKELLKSEQTTRSIKLRTVPKDFDNTAPAATAPSMSRQEAASQANKCVEKLKQNPNDTASREAFARLLAEQLEQPDLALEQMKLLLEMPGPPNRKLPEWLTLMANWHIRYRKDEASAQELLERLVREYPESYEAFTAQRRLNFMRQETKVRRLRTYLD